MVSGVKGVPSTLADGSSIPAPSRSLLLPGLLQGLGAQSLPLPGPAAQTTVRGPLVSHRHWPMQALS